MSKKNAIGEKQALAPQPNKPSIALPGIKLAEQALFYFAQPTLEQWSEHGQFLNRCHGSLAWWIGDWFLAGHAWFADEVYKHVDQFSPEALRKSVYVCSRIPPEHRKTTLSREHHEIVAHLPVESQIEWLDKAERAQLNPTELRASVRAGHVVRAEELEARHDDSIAELLDLQLFFADPRWLRFKRSEWARRNELPIEQRRAWLDMLKEAAEMYETLRAEMADTPGRESF